MDRSGAPTFSADRIIYYEDVPDTAFQPVIPQGLRYVETPSKITEQNISLLGGPRYGIAVADRTRQEVARDILRQVYEAIIEGDLHTLRTLCPLTDLWGNDYLEAVLLDRTPELRTTEIVDIGSITKRGHSSLGPFVIVPCQTKREDGSLWEVQMIVQFRGSGPNESCLVYGPYGMPMQID